MYDREPWENQDTYNSPLGFREVPQHRSKNQEMLDKMIDTVMALGLIVAVVFLVVWTVFS